MNFRKTLCRAVFIGLVGLLVAECWLWRAGYGDFPLYETDAEIGYIPKAQTAGYFADKHEWFFNEHSMRNGPFVGDANRDVLLLGDSIVFGGGITQHPHERLGACLERQYRNGRVWAASAGSWSLPNQLTYLERNPDVVAGVNRIVWVLNSGDLAGRTQWSSSMTHPTEKPFLLSFYLAQKGGPRLWNKLVGGLLGQHTPKPDYIAQIDPDTVTLAASINPAILAKTTFIWYPSKREMQLLLNNEPVKNFQKVSAALASVGITLSPVPIDSRWGADCYMDGIHPSKKGNEVLAAYIGEMLSK